MRTRKRTNVTESIGPGSVSGSFQTWNCAGTFVGTTPVTSSFGYVPVTYEDEWIEDGTGFKSQHGCHHRRKTFDASRESPMGAEVNPSLLRPDGLPGVHLRSGAFSTSLRATYATNLESILGMWPAKPSIHYNLPPRCTADLSSVNENSLIENCFEKARQLKADGLLNAAEAHQLWPSIQSLIAAIRHTENSRATRENWWRLLTRGLGKYSGGFLAYKFGISPLFDDIRSTLRYASQFRSDVEKLQKQSNRRFTSAAGYSFSFNSSPMGNWYPSMTVVKQPEVRYVLVVQPPTKYYTDAFAAASNVIDRFASSPASLGWELVPFSFVLDWFVDLRGLCRAVDNMLGISPFKIVSFTRSQSYELRSSLRFRQVSTCTGSEMLNEAAGYVEYKSYVRTLASSSATMPTWKPRFGKNQAGVSAALIAQYLATRELRRTNRPR